MGIRSWLLRTLSPENGKPERITHGDFARAVTCPVCSCAWSEHAASREAGQVAYQHGAWLVTHDAQSRFCCQCGTRYTACPDGRTITHDPSIVLRHKVLRGENGKFSSGRIPRGAGDGGGSGMDSDLGDFDTTLDLQE